MSDARSCSVANRIRRSQQFLIALTQCGWVCLTALGIYALAVGFEGHGEHPIPHHFRPVIFAIGVFLIWPTGRVSQIAAVLALAAVMILAPKLAATHGRTAPASQYWIMRDRD